MFYGEKSRWDLREVRFSVRDDRGLTLEVRGVNLVKFFFLKDLLRTIVLLTYCHKLPFSQP